MKIMDWLLGNKAQRFMTVAIHPVQELHRIDEKIFQSAQDRAAIEERLRQQGTNGPSGTLLADTLARSVPKEE